jgi:PTS system mannose-specific IIA component
MNEAMEKGSIIGIIITHGNLAEELLATVRMIVGDTHDCYAISGSDLCDGDVARRINELIGEEGRKRRAVVFVDYFGGSCSAATVRATHSHPDVRVISGVNLPILLDFVNKQDTYDLEEIVRHLLHRGRESIRIIKF